ncbi:MAG TPA: DUF2252 domain-containing protein, partial [Acidimicrobiales bacterium]
ADLTPPVPAHRIADVRHVLGPWSARRDAGRAMRAAVPRSSHADWSPPPDRNDPVTQLERVDDQRESALAPVRVARMASSSFAYYRGAADMMALDLVGTPSSGIVAQICGDAHCLNFGFYGSPTGLVVFDLNDFDETAPGPWEWDLKRLVVSLVLAGRGNGASDEDCRVAVQAAVRSYRRVADSFEDATVLNLWRLAINYQSPLIHRFGRDDPIFRRGFAKARRHDNASALPKLTEEEGGRRRFCFHPPLLTRLDRPVVEAVTAALEPYTMTTLVETRARLARYHVVDIAQKVVGVGSVGTQDFVVLLERDDGRPLFLQMKQAVESDVRRVLEGPPPDHEGERVVAGQRLLQAVSDRFLGWTTVRGVPFYVRQLKDLKASMPLATLTGRTLDDYGSLCAAILSRAHARTCDPAMISGYCGHGTRLDEALTRFAVSYADQIEQDHQAVKEAVSAGRLAADAGPDTHPQHALLGWPDLALGT